MCGLNKLNHSGDETRAFSFLFYMHDTFARGSFFSSHKELTWNISTKYANYIGEKESL